MLEIYFNFPSIIHFLLRVLYRAFLEVDCKKTWRPVHLVSRRMCSREYGAGRMGGGGGKQRESERGEEPERRGSRLLAGLLVPAKRLLEA